MNNIKITMPKLVDKKDYLIGEIRIIKDDTMYVKTLKYYYNDDFYGYSPNNKLFYELNIDDINIKIKKVNISQVLNMDLIFAYQEFIVNDIIYTLYYEYNKEYDCFEEFRIEYKGEVR